MEEARTNDLKKKRFLCGIALAWIPSFPFLISGIYSAVEGIESQRATGLGAVAGGLSEAYITSSITLMLLLEIAAIILLVGSFSRGHRMRSLFSVVSIGWTALVLSSVGLFVWLSVVYLPRANAAR
jgi:hypothetical protein